MTYTVARRNDVTARQLRELTEKVWALFWALSALSLFAALMAVAAPVFDAPQNDTAVAATATAAAATQTVAAGEVPEGLTADEWASIQQQITAQAGASTAATAATVSAPITTAALGAIGSSFGATLAPDGISFATDDIAHFGLATTALNGEPVQAASFYEANGQVIYERPGLVEWYQSVAGGIEQGFTVTTPTAAATLTLDVAFDSVTAATITSPTAAVLTTDAGKTFSYRDLYVVDATGATLPAWLTSSGSTVTINVDHTNAVYPITVDPIISDDQKVLPPQTAAGDNFGTALAVDGDVVVVAAPNHDTDGSDTGAVFVFRWDGASHVLEAILADAPSREAFGTSVAIAGDRILVGDPLADDNGGNSGTVYVYDYTGTWDLTNKLFACGTGCDATVDSGSFAGARFGTSVDIANVDTHDMIIVGAPGNPAMAGEAYVISTAGAVYTATEAFGIVVATLPGEHFGHAVAVSPNGHYFIAGAPKEDRGQTDQGAAYTFRDADLNADGINLVPDAPFGLTGDITADVNFGFAVDVGSSGASVVGAPSLTTEPGDTGGQQGEVYGFSLGGDLVQAVTPFGETDTGFGVSLELDSNGGTLIVGAPWVDLTVTNGGRAVRCLWADTGDISGCDTSFSSDNEANDRQGWDVAIDANGTHMWGAPFGNQSQVPTVGVNAFFGVDSGSATVVRAENRYTVDPTTDSTGDIFGADVAVDGNRLVVGAPDENDWLPDAGAAYVFERVGPGAPWIQTAVLRDPDARTDGKFGNEVAIAGDRIVIGQAFQANSAGRAIVFDLDGAWEPTWELTGDGATRLSDSAFFPHTVLGTHPASSNDNFGIAVEIIGDFITVGSPGSGTNAGAVHAWQLTPTTFLASGGVNGGDNGVFGFALGTDVDVEVDGIGVWRVVAGAPLDDTAGTQTGAVEVYSVQAVLNELTFTAETISADVSGFNLNRLGHAVAIDGQTIAAAEENSGPVYVFEDIDRNNNWETVTELAPSGVVAISNPELDIDNQVIAAGWRGTGGGIVTFERAADATWLEADSFVPGGVVDADAFGISLDLDGATLVGGVTGDDTSGSNAGAAYSFERTIDPNACTAWYDGGGNLSWDTRANWATNSVPVETDVVCVDAPGSVVEIDSFTSVVALQSTADITLLNDLNITGGPDGLSSTSTGQFNINDAALNVDSPATFFNGGSARLVDGLIGGTGTFQNDFGAELTITSEPTLDGLFVNEGDIHIVNGTGLVQLSGTLLNEATGIIDFEGAGNSGIDGFGVIDNRGVISAGGFGGADPAANKFITSAVTLDMDNGVIEVNDATLTIDAPGIWTGDNAFLVDADAVAIWNGDQSVAGTLTGEGILGNVGTVFLGGTKTGTNTELNFTTNLTGPMLRLETAELAGSWINVGDAAATQPDGVISGTFFNLGTLLIETSQLTITGTLSNELDGVIFSNTAPLSNFTGGGILSIDGTLESVGPLLDLTGLSSVPTSADSDIIAGTDATIALPTIGIEGTLTARPGGVIQLGPTSGLAPGAIINIEIDGPSADPANYGSIEPNLGSAINGTLTAVNLGHTVTAADSYPVIFCNDGCTDDGIVVNAGAGLVANIDDEGVTLDFAAPSAPSEPSVAHSRDLNAVGVPADDVVYLVHREGFGPETPYETIDANTPGEDFGAAVGLYGPNLLVGAPAADRVYFYRRNPAGAYGLSQTLAGNPGSQFGASIDITENKVIIGAPGDDTAGIDAGAAVVYTITAANISPDATLLAAEAGDAFGTSVAIDAIAAWVGAPGDDGDLDAGLADQGAVYRFDGPTAWTLDEIARVVPSASGNGLGQVLGADNATAVSAAADGVYVFRHAVTISATALAPPASASATFGDAVSLSGNRLIVNDRAAGLATWYSDNGDNPNYVEAGTYPGNYTDVHTDGAVFARTLDFTGPTINGTELLEVNFRDASGPKYLAQPASPRDQFGSAVAIDDDTILVAAPQADPGDTRNSGAVFVFEDGEGFFLTHVIDDVDGLSNALDIENNVAVFGVPNGLAVYTRPGSFTDFTLLSQFVIPGGLGTPATLDLEGDVLAIGFPSYNSSAGIVGVYTGDPSTWAAQTPQTVGVASPGDRFGTDVDVSGNTLIAGAPGGASFSSPNTATGYAQLFTRPDAGSAFAFAASHSGGAGEFYGWDVEIEDNRYAISAPLGAANEGEIELFESSTNSLLDTIANTTGGTDRFGYAMGLDSGLLAVGTWTDTQLTYDVVSSPTASLIEGVVHEDWEPGDTTSGSHPIATSNGVVVSGARLEAEAGRNAGAMYLFYVDAPDPLQPNELVAPDGAGFDFFGQSVAVHEDWMVVGARSADGAVGNSGAAYAFNYDGTTWNFHTKIEAPVADATNGAWFGQDVALAGQTIMTDGSDGELLLAVGAPAPFDGPGAGEVFTYKYSVNDDAWALTGTIIAADNDGSFGYAVDLQQFGAETGPKAGYLLATGAPAISAGLTSVHLHEIVTSAAEGDEITLLDRTTGSDLSADNFFGFDVAIDGNIVVAGARQADPGGVIDAGTAEVFDVSSGGFVSTAVLSQPAGDVTADAGFGHAIALDGRTLVVSAFLDDNDTGAIYVYDGLYGVGGGISAPTKLVGSAGPFGNFGFNVAVENGVVLASAFYGGDDGQGTVYQFEDTDGWLQVAELPFVGSSGDGAGSGLALGESGHVIIGAAEATTMLGFNSGSVQYLSIAVPNPINKLTDADSITFDHEPGFTGYSVDTDGEWIVVGTPQIGNDGRALVFRNNGGTISLFDTLVDNVNPNFDDRFGVQVAIANDTIYIGECNEGWIFEFDGLAWQLGDIIDVPVGINDCVSGFSPLTPAWGSDVDLSDDGDTLVVGSPSVSGIGVVSVFRQTGGFLSNFFEDGVNPPFLVSAGDQYGTDVAITSDTIFATAPFVEEVHVLDRTGTEWDLVDTLQDATVPVFGAVGVDADGDTAIVGNSDNTATVFVNTDGAWSQEEKLSAGVTSNAVGGDVSIDQNIAVIGTTFALRESVATGGAVSFVRNASIWTMDSEWQAADREHGDAFGFSVNVSGDTIIVGAPFDTNGAATDPDGVFAGGAYAFGTTNPVDVVDPPNKLIGMVAGDNAGESVAVADNKLLVGAPQFNSENTGTVYAFGRVDDGPWVFEAELTTSTPLVSGDGFGYAVALAGSEQDAHYTAAVGTFERGDVFLFEWTDITGWNELAPGGTPTSIPGVAGFGRSLDMNRLAGGFRTSAMALVIGNTNQSGGGEARVYRVESDDTWTAVDTLTSSTQDDGETFGESVAIDGDTIIVGNSTDNITIAGGGSATVFRADTQNLATWTEEATLVQPSAITAGDSMGSSVDIDNGVALVGLRLDSAPGGGDAGSALVFSRTGTVWNAGTRLNPADAQPTDQFGTAVALQDGVAAVGARGVAGSPGKVALFTQSAGSWTEGGNPLADDAQADDRFGIALDLSEAGDLVVGAPVSTSSSGDVAGGAYFYDIDLVEPANQLISPITISGESTFGGDVSVDGDTMLVTAPLTDAGGANESGSAFVFTRAGGVWTLQQELPNPANGASDRYARRGAVQGDVVVLSDSGDGVHVWTRSGSTWTYDQLLQPDADITSGFGSSLDFDGNTVVIGEKANGVAGNAFVFERNALTGTWTEEIVLTPADQTTTPEFRVAISGDRLMVSAAQHAGPGASGSGRVYAYSRDGATWTQNQVIDHPNESPGDLFGTDIDIDGFRAIIGARGDDEVSGASGAAFVFELLEGTWSDVAKLTPASQETPSDFGRSVAIEGSVAAMGSILDQVQGLRSGSALVFSETGGVWTQSRVLEPADRESRQYFASTMDISGLTVAVGAPYDNNDNGPGAGAAYTFVVAAPPQPDDPTLSFDFDLAAGSPTEVQVAPTGLRVADFNTALLEDEADNASSVAASPLSSIEVENTPLSSIDVQDTPLSSIILGSTPLSSIPLLNVDIDGGWDDIIVDTDLADRPFNELTFFDLLSEPTAAARLASTPLSSIDVGGTPLSSIPLSSIALGTVPLSSIPLSSIDTGTEPPLDWCEVVQAFLGDVVCTTEADLDELTLMEATLRGVPLSSIPLSSIPLSSIPLSSIPLSSIPLSSIPLSSIDFAATPLSSIPLSSIDVGSTPLSSIPLSSIPLSSIPLSSIGVAGSPLSSITVDGTPLSSIPLSSIPLSSIPISIPLSSIPLSSIPLSSIPLSSIPLSSIPLSSIVLADVPLSSIPLSSIDGTPIDWCDLLADLGFADCGSGIDPTTSTLTDLSVRGVPLSSIPLSSIPLSSITVGGLPLSSIPLSSIPLSSIPLSSIPLSSIPLSSIDLQNTPLSSIDPDATPLSSIPLSSIPLSSIDVQGSPLSSIPLSSIDLGATPLSSIPLSSIPLSSIPLSSIGVAGSPLSSITVNGTPLSSIPLSSINLGATPLSSIPLSSIDLASIGVNCALVDCETGSLGDARAANAFDPTAVPLSSIPLSSIRLGDLADFFAGETRAQIEAQVAALTGLLGDLPNLDDLTLGDLPFHLAQVQQTLLGSLQIGTFEIRFGDLIGALIDPTTGLPYADADAQAALRLAVDLAGAEYQEFGDLDALGDVTLGELIETSDGDFTLDALGPLLGLIKVQDLLDQLLNPILAPQNVTLAAILDLGDLTLLDLFGENITEFDTLDVMTLLIALQDAGALDGFTLGDLLLALFGEDGLPVSGVNFSTVEVGQLPENTVPSVRFTTGVLVDNTTAAHGVRIGVELPTTATYLPGTASVVITPDLGGPLPAQPAEPTVTDNELVWELSSVAPGDKYEVSFDVLPTIGLGITALDATASIVGTDTFVSATASIAVAEGLEDNNFPLTTAADEDSVYLFYLPDAIDNDVFELTLQENDRLAIELSNLPVDFDLAVYADAADAQTDASLSGQNGNVPIIPVTDPDGGTVDSEVQEDFRRLDLEDPNLTLIDVSNSRGLDDEVLVTDRLAAGTYYVQVFGANGASSPQPAALQLQVLEAETQPECLPRGALPAATAGIQASIDPSVNTLFLVNEQRIEQIYSAGDRTAITNEMNSLIGYLDANSALGVDAAIVPVDANAVVRAAYAQLDNPANPEDSCAVETTNAVVSAIVSQVLDPIRATNDIEHIVFVGGDDIVPMARLTDATAVANEYDFRHEFDGDLPGGVDNANSFTASFWGQTYLSDEPYGETASQSLGDRFLYVSDAALGRLVETPDEIIATMQSFQIFQGNLDVTTGAVLGYDFLEDGSREIADDLISGLGSANVDDELADGVNAAGNAWDRVDAENILVPADGNSPDLISLNAHFDHYRALPAVGDQVAGFEDNLMAETVAAALPESVLDGSLVFSMGCHSGLSVSDVQIGATNNDWAQTLSGQGALFVGNTGFGYGDTESVAYSERLMALFAELVVEPLDLVGDGSSTTVGQALTYAKQRYIADLAVLSVYDEKALMESTFYGLPFYRVGLPTVPADPAPVNETSPDGTGTASLNVSIDAENNANITPIGVIYSNPDESGDPMTISAPGRPIQPQAVADISVVDNLAPDALDAIAHGAILLGMDSEYLTPINPVVATAVFDDSDGQPEPELGDVVFPAQPVTVNRYNAPEGERQNLVVSTGQYRANGQTQRLDDNLELVVYYSDTTETDFTPPTIGMVESTLADGIATIDVTVNDDTLVDRVYVLLAENPGSNTLTWRGVDLAPSGPNQWSSAIAVDAATTTVEFLVQAKDPAGNVGVATNKAANFTDDLIEDAAPPVFDLTAVVTGPLDGPTGWYTGPATVTVTTSEPVVQYKIGTGPFTSLPPGGGAFTVSGEGVRRWTVLTANGQTLTGTVRIDTAPPQALVGPPTPGASYAVGSNTKLGLLCRDNGIGISSCTATLDGNPITPGQSISAISGPHTIVATAVDGLGKTTTTTVSYVVNPPVNPLTAGPLVLSGNIGLGDQITAAMEFSGGVAPYTSTIVWGDGASCTNADPSCSLTNPVGATPGTVNGTHGYPFAAGYIVKATVTDANGASVSSTATTQYCTIEGTPGNDWLVGTSGNDVICSYAGNDLILSGDGFDIIFAIGGNNLIVGGAGVDLVFAGNGGDFIGTGGGNDVVFAGGGNDIVGAGSGNNIVYGQPGNDLLYGGNGNDQLRGGGGNDLIYGGGGADIIRGAGDDDILRGDGGDDDIRGGRGNDNVRGGSGNDTLSGQGGDDNLRGDSGTDSSNGGPDTDTCDAETETNCEL